MIYAFSSHRCSPYLLLNFVPIYRWIWSMRNVKIVTNRSISVLIRWKSSKGETSHHFFEWMKEKQWLFKPNEVFIYENLGCYDSVKTNFDRQNLLDDILQEMKYISYPNIFRSKYILSEFGSCLFFCFKKITFLIKHSHQPHLSCVNDLKFTVPKHISAKKLIEFRQSDHSSRYFTMGALRNRFGKWQTDYPIRKNESRMKTQVEIDNTNKKKHKHKHIHTQTRSDENSELEAKRTTTV